MMIMSVRIWNGTRWVDSGKDIYLTILPTYIPDKLLLGVCDGVYYITRDPSQLQNCWLLTDVIESCKVNPNKFNTLIGLDFWLALSRQLKLEQIVDA